MHLSLDHIRWTEDGVLICDPQGDVLLKQSSEGITAEYGNGPLVDGTATAFAEKVKRIALDYALKIRLPWTVGDDGSIRIHDHQTYYEQTFSATTYALETLKRWAQE